MDKRHIKRSSVERFPADHMSFLERSILRKDLYRSSIESRRLTGLQVL